MPSKAKAAPKTPDVSKTLPQTGSTKPKSPQAKSTKPTSAKPKTVTPGEAVKSKAEKVVAADAGTAPIKSLTKNQSPAVAAIAPASGKARADKSTAAKTAPIKTAPGKNAPVKKKAAAKAGDKPAPEVAIAALAPDVKDAAVSKTAPKTDAAPSKADAAPGGEVNLTAEASAAKRKQDMKTAAAALLAARRKAPSTSAVKDVVAGAPADQTNLASPAPGDVETGKGTVQVADKNAKKAVVDSEANVGPAPAPAVAVRKPVVPARPAAPVTAPKTAKPGARNLGFKTNEFIVYPAHGVGEIVAIEEQEVAGYKLELFVISFIKDKMILKVPLPKIASVGMRKLADPAVVKRALDTLTGRARIKRTMWSRRAQEYEAKINSGDLVAIAEVVRDLYRSEAQPEQSYSERQLYEAALDRMAREIAAVQSLTDTEALKVIDDQLRKGPRRGKVEESEAEVDEDSEDVGEAA